MFFWRREFRPLLPLSKAIFFRVPTFLFSGSFIIFVKNCKSHKCVFRFDLGWYFYLNCELCGSNIRGEVQVIDMDGGVFRVCKGCSKFGTAARVPKPVVKPQNVSPSAAGFAPRSAGASISKPRL